MSDVLMRVWACICNRIVQGRYRWVHGGGMVALYGRMRSVSQFRRTTEHISMADIAFATLFERYNEGAFQSLYVLSVALMLDHC